MQLLFILLSNANRAAFAEAIAMAAGQQNPVIFTGTPAQGAAYLAERAITPTHIVLDIGYSDVSVLQEIDQLAHQCTPETRVLAVGDVNDIQLYRGLLSRGISDYLPMPADPAEIVRLLTTPSATAPATPIIAKPFVVPTALGGEKRIISFMSAASGDGASTAAVNVAYTIAEIYGGKTLLIDMDYQYGMVAKHLDLKNQYGIRDLFDHPDRAPDATLIRRMAESYGKLDIITAPSEMRYLPHVSTELIGELLAVLKQNYDNIILDLPHVWMPWVAAACQQSTHIVLIAQLWLKSVSHAARMMRVLRELNIPTDKILPVINRSGAKFKEAIDARDFERVCGTQIRYTLNNDIRAIVEAEANAKTVMELEACELANDIDKLARYVGGAPALRDIPAKGGFFSRRKG